MSTTNVVSADGTSIAVTREGSGPAVVLVGGGLDDGTENAALVPALAEHFTVHNYARRGRGASGDAPEHSLDREIDDLAAVVEEAGGSAHVFGASSGGALALEAAAAGVAIERVAVYDVPYCTDPAMQEAWTTYVRDVGAALRRGDTEEALRLFFRVAGVPEETFEGAKASPYWPQLTALAPTLAYDATVLGDGTVPVERFAAIGQPVLVTTAQDPDPVMADADPGFFAAAARGVSHAIPGAQLRTLPVAGHMVNSEVVAPVLVEFFAG